MDANNYTVKLIFIRLLLLLNWLRVSVNDGVSGAGPGRTLLLTAGAGSSPPVTPDSIRLRQWMDECIITV